MDLFRVISLCLLICNSQLCFASSDDDYNRIFVGEWTGYDPYNCVHRTGDYEEEKIYNSSWCLKEAVKCKSEETLKDLLDNGADKYAQDDSGCSAMSLAIRKGWKVGVAAFVRAGYDVNKPDITVDDIIAKHPERPYFRKVSCYGCNQVGALNPRADYCGCSAFIGETPLMKAVGAGEYDIAKMFVHKGAGVNAENYDEKSALDYAFGRFGSSCAFDKNNSVVQQEMVALLVDYGARIKPESGGVVQPVESRPSKRLKTIRAMGIDTSRHNG